MALTDITIDFDLAQLLGADFDARRTKAYVTTNVESGTLMDTSTGETRLGDEAVTIASDGTGSFTTWATGADGNPISWQTSLVVDYPRTGQRDRKRRTFGPWTLTAADDGKNITALEDEQAVPAEYVTAVTAELQTYSDSASNSASTASAAATTASAAATTASGAADTAVNAAGLASEIALGDGGAALAAADLDPGSAFRLQNDPRLAAAYVAKPAIDSADLSLLMRDRTVANGFSWTTPHAAIARALGWIIVTDYGVVGDGVANDTAGITTARTAAVGKKLYWPPGTYLTDKITYAYVAEAGRSPWVGAGPALSKIKKRTADGQPLLDINPSPTSYFGGLQVEGLRFEGFAGDTPGVVRSYDLVRSQFVNCYFTGGIVGCQQFGGIGNHYLDCKFESNVNGVTFDTFVGGVGMFPNLNTLNHCEIINNTGWGLKFSAGRSLAVLDCDIEGNGTNGVVDSGGAIIGTNIGSEGVTLALGATFQRCWFESNAGAASLKLGSGRNKVDSSYFVANPNSTNDIIIDGGRYVIEDCDIDTAKAVSILENAGVASGNYIINTDVAGGVTTDPTKTTREPGIWTTYTSALGGTGWAIGNGTITARYRKDGTSVDFSIEVTFDTTSTFGTASPTLGLPVAAADADRVALVAEANDVGSNIYRLYPTMASTAGVRLNVHGTNGASVTTTSTVPFTWASGDKIMLHGNYEAA